MPLYSAGMASEHKGKGAIEVFKAFHPYLTYTNEKKLFIGPDGQPSFSGWGDSYEDINDSDDLSALWELGKDAFDALGDIKTNEDFKTQSDLYIESIKYLRLAIGQSLVEVEAKTNSANDRAGPLCLDVDDFADETVVEVACQISQWLPKQAESSERLRRSLLFTCFNNIDAAIIAKCLNADGSVSSAIAAARAFAIYQEIEWSADSLERVRSKLAADSAMARYKKDPKQKEKIFVKECWAIWQTRPDSYDGKASFARAMLDKCEHLQSQKKIEDWCRAWEAETVAVPVQ